jgi:aryl-alcohol dehydrogenase-like predicted oxidoreductase
LRLERIELYQLHTVDSKVPYADQVGALVDLQREGKIRYIGVSNVDVGHLRVARSLARVVSVQNRYNATDRESEPVLDVCDRDGIVFIPWFPLDAGDIASWPAAQGIARHHGCTVFQVAIAWLLRRSPWVVPIPGTSSVEHLEENVAAGGIVLSEGEFAELNAR